MLSNVNVFSFIFTRNTVITQYFIAAQVGLAPLEIKTLMLVSSVQELSYYPIPKIHRKICEFVVET
jgi:hypothetical protein